MRSQILAVSLAATLLTGLGSVASAQSSPANDYFGSWRWSQGEAILNLQAARLIELQNEGELGSGIDVDNDYRGANFGQQSTMNIGTQTVQECEISDGGTCSPTANPIQTNNGAQTGQTGTMPEQINSGDTTSGDVTNN